ncbi:MAG: preprotein translocase subunit SecE [candidate division Zixibacteria bacterium]|nr:preprotein translocase subunit SecE [candidate division Zixibacteria bacterium]
MNKITKFLKEVRQELTKVAWPSKDELRDSTIVVIVLSILLSAFIGVVDFGLSRITTLILR